MQVNSDCYTVYPNFRSLILTNKTFAHEQAIDDLNEGNTCMLLSRQVTVTEFLDTMLTQAKGKESMDKQQVESLLMDSIKAFAK